MHSQGGSTLAEHPPCAGEGLKDSPQGTRIVCRALQEHNFSLSPMCMPLCWQRRSCALLTIKRTQLGPKAKVPPSHTRDLELHPCSFGAPYPSSCHMPCLQRAKEHWPISSDNLSKFSRKRDLIKGIG